MTPAERKAIGYIVRQACDLYAATMDGKPIWENRERMREFIGQHVDAELPLLSGGYLAEYVIASNRRPDCECPAVKAGFAFAHLADCPNREARPYA